MDLTRCIDLSDDAANDCVLSRFSHVWLVVTPWTVARQAPSSMGFFRQEYWSGLPCPAPGDLPNPGIKPPSLMSPVLAGRFFTTSATWEEFLASLYRLREHRSYKVHWFVWCHATNDWQSCFANHGLVRGSLTEWKHCPASAPLTRGILELCDLTHTSH